MKADTVLTLTPLDNNGQAQQPFFFSNTEVPHRIGFGGDQLLAVHQLVGGKRVVDAMGRSDMPLEWSGLFMGKDALSRARYLDYLRTQGWSCLLTWSELSYKVVIQSFKAEFERYYQIPYQISCVVVEDKAKPVTSTVYSIDTAIGDDMSIANALGGIIGDGPLSELLGALDTAISTVSTFAGAVQSTINTVLAPIALINERVQILIGTAGNTIQNVTTIGGIFPNNSVAQQANSLLGQVSAMNSIPQLYYLQSVMGRMSSNLGSVNASGSTVNVSGGNLMKLAQQQYGDATDWTVIAKANAMTDPVISGTQTLTLPNNATSTGGVLGP